MDKFISTKEVCVLVGLSRTQITEKPPRAGMEEFPEPIHIGFRRLYVEAEVEAWQQKQLLKRTPPPKRERKSNEPHHDDTSTQEDEPAETSSTSPVHHAEE